MNRVCLNGSFIDESLPVLHASNRGYRYGDGLFETIRIAEGKLVLCDFHFERLFNGLEMLLIKYDFSRVSLIDSIRQLAEMNGITGDGRIRLSVFRGNGSLYETGEKASYLIECWPVDPPGTEMKKISIGIFEAARKPMDSIAGLKTSGFLPYALAAQHAVKNNLDDMLLLNTEGRIADSAISNLFIVRRDIIETPALSEGCVAGVTRKFILSNLSNWGYAFHETRISVDDLASADEIFLTNAITGMRSVRSFGTVDYRDDVSRNLFRKFLQTIPGTAC